MGNVRKWKLILLIGLIASFVILMNRIRVRNNVDFLIFNSLPGNELKKFVGYIPNHLKRKFLLKEVNENLVVAIHKNGTSHEFVFFQNERGSLFLMRGLNTLGYLCNSWENHVSCLIDIDIFNMYLQYQDIDSKPAIIDSYIKILCKYEDVEFCAIEIESFDDIKKLISNKEIKFDSIASGYKFLDLEDKNFSISPDKHYYWIYNMGVVEFDFKIHNGMLYEVKTNIVGVLGIENL